MTTAIRSASEPTYLGDGAYVELTAIGLRLYTSDGISVTNEIYLGTPEWLRLTEFVSGGEPDGAEK